MDHPISPSLRLTPDGGHRPAPYRCSPPQDAGMSGVVATPTGRTYLAPDDEFPADLTELSPAELHVLHSRVGRQLDREYLGGASGAHPITLERQQELAVELDAREIAHSQHAR